MDTNHVPIRRRGLPAYFLGRPSAVYIDRFRLPDRGRNPVRRDPPHTTH